jgi:hypothetical protein
MVVSNCFPLEIQADMICSVAPLRYSRNKFHTHRRDVEKGKMTMFWGERGDGNIDDRIFPLLLFFSSINTCFF